MIYKKKIILLCLVSMFCVNFTACSKDNKNTQISKATSQDITDYDFLLLCKVKLENIEINALKTKFENHKNVSAYKFVTKEEVNERAEKLLKMDNFFVGEYANILPVSFEIKLKDGSKSDSFYNELKADERIDKILKNKKVDAVK